MLMISVAISFTILALLHMFWMRICLPPPKKDRRFLEGFHGATVAHRGCVDDVAPENTLRAFQRAFQAGYRVIELDVRLTQDLEVVAFHDRSIERMLDGRGLVSELSYDEIAVRNFFGNGVSDDSVPTLQQVISFVSERKLKVLLELKECSFGTRTTAFLHKVAKCLEGYHEHVVVISFMPQLLYGLRQVDARIHVGLLYERAFVQNVVHEFMKDHRVVALLAPLLGSLHFSMMKSGIYTRIVGASLIGPHINDLTPAHVQSHADNSMLSYAWGKPQSAEHLMLLKSSAALLAHDHDNHIHN